ncbi:FAD-binding domain-containing protein [Apiospora saccharicola]|uniref:FAD-binding domain-containing protein n=1 Tax=Apiospora saccharicola TaxID=335842 RepID=A0ABR1V8M4_9PEZI
MQLSMHRTQVALHAALAISNLALAVAVPPPPPPNHLPPPPPSTKHCRVLPGDAEWPSQQEWTKLNQTIGGRLISSVPLGQACYVPTISADRPECAKLRDEWVDPKTYYEDPVNVMSPFWLNNSCTAFIGPAASGTCILGNMASFAVEVDGPKTVADALKFAKEKNMRISIKNTGHDYIGRSNGKGSLALWTHKLKTMSFIDYKGRDYHGPALKAGAGVQFMDAYKAAADKGLRVLGGYCSSVGMVGGYVQGGGHGPLAASYGMAADNTLEFEVVTVDGRHLVASPTQNSDLYWALSGGGGGNYALVLSATVKAHPDGQTAGAALAFANTDPETYWKAVGEFQKHLLYLNTIPGLATSWGFDNRTFSLDSATLTGGTKERISSLLDPFVQKLKQLNMTLLRNDATDHSRFYDQYTKYGFPPEVYSTNNTIGGRLIPPSTVEKNLGGLVGAFRRIATDGRWPNRISAISLNVTHARVGNQPGANAVLPAWRDALYTLNLGIGFPADTPWPELQAIQAAANEWQALFTPLTPDGGGYMNEATWDNPTWKADYFGANYEKLLQVKRRYDPEFALWQHTSVGADVYWQPDPEGRLCRVR